jgi:hypothetical protein
MSLGLGELSPDLFGVAPLAEARRVRPQAQLHPPVFDLDSEEASFASPLPESEGASADEAIDLSALLESLDRVQDEPVSAQDTREFDQFGSVELEDSSAETLRGASQVPPPESSSGAASIQAYGDDPPFDAMGFSGGMTDELSALTGADRPARPVVNVSGIPDPGSGVLSRDLSVDKDTLLRIIDGIKSL